MTAATNIFTAIEELNHAVKELSKRLAAIDNAIASIGDAETRSQLKQSSKLSQETLSSAMLQLTQVIGELVGRRAGP